MRYIKSSWSGFEIDSSEYSTVIALANPLKGIKALINSSNISSYSVSDKSLENIERALRIIETEKKQDALDFNFEVAFSKIDKLRGEVFSKEDVIWITEISNKIVKIFPYLTFEFLESTITLNVEEEYINNSSTISLIGVPIVQNHHLAWDGTAKTTIGSIAELTDRWE